MNLGDFNFLNVTETMETLGCDKFCCVTQYFRSYPVFRNYLRERKTKTKIASVRMKITPSLRILITEGKKIVGNLELDLSPSS